MTLVFLGNSSPERQHCLCEIAADVRARPFELQLDRLGVWRRPRLYWCAPAHSSTALEDLVKQLQQNLSVCDYEPEQRPFAPHVTLARKILGVGRVESLPPITWRVTDFVLVQSISGGPPPKYRLLGRWALPGD